MSQRRSPLQRLPESAMAIPLGQSLAEGAAVIDAVSALIPPVARLHRAGLSLADIGGGVSVPERSVVGVEIGVVVLEVEHPCDAGEVDAVGDQDTDPAKPRDVGVAVAAGAADGAGWFEQSFAFVQPKGLHTHPGELGGGGDAVNAGGAVAGRRWWCGASGILLGQGSFRSDRTIVLVEGIHNLHQQAHIDRFLWTERGECSVNGAATSVFSARPPRPADVQFSVARPARSRKAASRVQRAGGFRSRARSATPITATSVLRVLQRPMQRNGRSSCLPGGRSPVGGRFTTARSRGNGGR